MIVSAYGHYLITCTIYASQYLLSFKTFREGMYKCDSNSNEHAPPAFIYASIVLVVARQFQSLHPSTFAIWLAVSPSAPAPGTTAQSKRSNDHPDQFINTLD